jgi:tetratricopeptide (TPR) repeat protein
MKKKQGLLALIGIIIVGLLFWLGPTEQKTTPIQSAISQKKPESFDIQSVIDSVSQALPDTVRAWADSTFKIIASVSNPSEKASRALDFANQLIKIKNVDPILGAYWASEAIKLDNSQKNLTFASQLLLTQLRNEHDERRLDWLTTETIDCFEQAIVKDSTNEDLKIGLGSCYLFGRGRNGDPQETMKGIQQLLGVVRRDSTNMKAQLMLGIGGLISGQNDKAITRLLKVVEQQPENIEAVAFLADAYAASGKNAEAIKWYEVSKRLVNNTAYSREADARIKELSQKP